MLAGTIINGVDLGKTSHALSHDEEIKKIAGIIAPAILFVLSVLITILAFKEKAIWFIALVHILALVGAILGLTGVVDLGDAQREALNKANIGLSTQNYWIILTAVTGTFVLLDGFFLAWKMKNR